MAVINYSSKENRRAITNISILKISVGKTKSRTKADETKVYRKKAKNE